MLIKANLLWQSLVSERPVPSGVHDEVAVTSHVRGVTKSGAR